MKTLNHQPLLPEWSDCLRRHRKQLRWIQRRQTTTGKREREIKPAAQELLDNNSLFD